MQKNIPISRQVFTLAGREYLTPHFIRITLQGEDVTPYEICTIGVNNKILLPPAGVKKVHLPVYDDETKEWTEPETHLKPIMRTYTHRGIDHEKNQLIVDFVYHGDNGPASDWAQNAQPGDEVGIAMKLVKSDLYPQADWYFLIGDATAIPVISSILESLPAHARGIAILETFGKEDEQKLQKPDDFELVWIHNSHPEEVSELSNAVKLISIPEEVSKFAYVAAEFSTVKDLRNYFRKELGWNREELYAYSYWKSGVAEDRSVSERQAEKKSLE